MYNYLDSMKEDVLNYIKDEVTLKDYSDRNELEEYLNDALWTEDSVTGNASGSYTFNRAQAKEYVQDDGFEYINDLVSEFDIDAAEIGKHFLSEDWEWFDVSIRCYLLGQAIAAALDEISDEEYKNDEEEEEA